MASWILAYLMDSLSIDDNFFSQKSCFFLVFGTSHCHASLLCRFTPFLLLLSLSAFWLATPTLDFTCSCERCIVRLATIGAATHPYVHLEAGVLLSLFVTSNVVACPTLFQLISSSRSPLIWSCLRGWDLFYVSPLFWECFFSLLSFFPSPHSHDFFSWC